MPKALNESANFSDIYMYIYIFPQSACITLPQWKIIKPCIIQIHYEQKRIIIAIELWAKKIIIAIELCFYFMPCACKFSAIIYIYNSREFTYGMAWNWRIIIYICIWEIDFAPIGIPVGAKYIGKVYMQSKFVLD